MKTNRRRFLQQVACLGAVAASPAAWAKTDILPFPELRAGGSPGSMGVAHGKTFATQVKHNVAFYLDYLTKATGNHKRGILTLAHGFTDVLARHVPELLEEMTGIAKGAGCTLDEILAVNARSDLLVLGRRKATHAHPARQLVPGCTALALEEHATAKTLLALVTRTRFHSAANRLRRALSWTSPATGCTYPRARRAETHGRSAQAFKYV